MLMLLSVLFLDKMVGFIHTVLPYTQGRGEEDSNNDLLGKPDQMPGGGNL